MRTRRLVRMGFIGMVGTAQVHPQIPGVPFSGLYGSTTGAGGVVVWDRSGAGENPAALGPPGWTASVAGYAPFGLDDARVAEILVARDGARWGLSGSCRAAATAAQSRLQIALRPAPAWTGGLEASYLSAPAALTVSGGMLWRPKRWIALGAFAARESAAQKASAKEAALLAGTGLEGGGALHGVRWRACAEVLYARRDADPEGRWNYRFGGSLRFHTLLSIYAGLDPRIETASAGVRFGFGEWEGFSAMRRHSALGGTSLQGLRWQGFVTASHEDSARP